jgi:hypothetical protein
VVLRKAHKHEPGQEKTRMVVVRKKKRKRRRKKCW